MVNVNCETFTLLYIARQNEDAPRKTPTRQRSQDSKKHTKAHRPYGWICAYKVNGFRGNIFSIYLIFR